MYAFHRTTVKPNETDFEDFNISADQPLSYKKAQNCSAQFICNETSSSSDWLKLCLECQTEVAPGIQILLPFGLGSCFIAIVSSAILQLKGKFMLINKVVNFEAFYSKL